MSGVWPTGVRTMTSTQTKAEAVLTLRVGAVLGIVEGLLRV